MDEHFRCDGCGRIIEDPPTAPTRCSCGGTIYRYIRATDARNRRERDTENSPGGESA